MGNKHTRRKWSAPSTHQRTLQLKRCGKQCFLGPNKSFPICSANTCKVNKQGLHAAYVRARQFHHNRIAKHAKRLMTRRRRRHHHR